MGYPSPFQPRFETLNETWKYKDWAGLLAPCRFVENHIYEYTAFRQSTGMLDVTALYKYEISGAAAAGFLSRITSRNVAKLKPGRVTYLCWCDDNGKVVDDGTVTRLAEDRFVMTAAEPQYGWLQKLAGGMAVVVEDISRTTAALALQGPTSRRLLVDVCGSAVEPLKFFGAMESSIAGKPVRVSRTGYTGDLGYEVWCAWDDGLAVWDALMEAGRAHGIVPVGLDALDMARVEAGFIMMGVDYFSAPHVTVDVKKYSPYELGLDWTVELERDPFMGQAALRQEQAAGGPPRALVGLELDWPHLESMYRIHGMAPQISNMASRDSLPIYLAGTQVGRVSSSSWSPSLKRFLAIGTVLRPYAEEGMELDVEHTVLFERKTVRARVVKRPFFDPERKRRP